MTRAISLGLILAAILAPGLCSADELQLQRSAGLAIWTWGLSCQSLQIEALPTDAPADELGEAASSGCSIALASVARLRDYAAVYVDQHITRRMRLINLQAARQVACTIIVHEGGHLAGLGHSPDPNNVMYQYQWQVYPPCRWLFAKYGP